MRAKLVITWASIGWLCVPAQAHVTLQQKEARVGSVFEATFRVPHGCGKSPTVRLRVRIPDGVVDVQPIPKPDWQIDVRNGKAANGQAARPDRIVEVDWSGRLPHDSRGEFVLRASLDNNLVAGRMLYFPVVQECEAGVRRWIEIPRDGKAPADSREAAPGLMLIPKAID
jgi:uncharacterized protein YcnI